MQNSCYGWVLRGGQHGVKDVEVSPETKGSGERDDQVSTWYDGRLQMKSLISSSTQTKPPCPCRAENTFTNFPVSPLPQPKHLSGAGELKAGSLEEVKLRASDTDLTAWWRWPQWPEGLGR